MMVGLLEGSTRTLIPTFLRPGQPVRASLALELAGPGRAGLLA